MNHVICIICAVLRSTEQYGAVLRSICRANRSRFEFPARCCAVPRSTARSVNAALGRDLDTGVQNLDLVPCELVNISFRVFRHTQSDGTIQVAC